MNSASCCENSRLVDLEARHEPWWMRARQAAGIVLPSMLLTLLPKCPMCLAAYLALGTGLTMSFSSAQLLMRTLTVLCVGLVALCGVKGLLNYSLKKRTDNLQPRPVRS